MEKSFKDKEFNTSEYDKGGHGTGKLPKELNKGGMGGFTLEKNI